MFKSSFRIVTYIVTGVMLAGYVSYGTKAVANKVHSAVMSWLGSLGSQLETQNIDSAKSSLAQNQATLKDLSASRDQLRESLQAMQSRKEKIATEHATLRRKLRDLLTEDDRSQAALASIEEYRRLAHQIAELDSALIEGSRAVAAIDQQIAAAARNSDDQTVALEAQELLHNARVALARGDQLLNATNVEP